MDYCIARTWLQQSVAWVSAWVTPASKNVFGMQRKKCFTAENLKIEAGDAPLSPEEVPITVLLHLTRPPSTKRRSHPQSDLTFMTLVVAHERKTLEQP